MKVYSYIPSILYHTMIVLLEYIDHSLQFPLILLLIFALHFLIMLALCLMFSITHYAQNYAGIKAGSYSH